MENLNQQKPHSFTRKEIIELEALNYHANDLIAKLLDVIEEELPEFYSKSDLVYRSDEWLRWYNDEFDIPGQANSLIKTFELSDDFEVLSQKL